MMKQAISTFLFTLLLQSMTMVFAADTVPTDIQQPGTQPQEISNLESPDKCDNCHGGYNSAVEPAHLWRGSMMAHAGRDPIFWATLAIAEQDFAGSGDLCIRCHSTGGWLAGRSTPTDGSGLAAGDSDGVECDYCHKLTDPDNSDPVLQGVMNHPFIANKDSEGFYGSGMSSMWGGGDKLGPYDNAEARHQFIQSAFHRDPDFCGTCHDVSNPAVGDLAHNHGVMESADPVIADGTPGSAVEGKAAFNNPPFRYGVVERTYSEYKAGLLPETRVSSYPLLPDDLKGGAIEAIYEAALVAGTNGDYEDGTPRYYSCQSCHMRPVTGTGANKRGVPVRKDLPLHDLTGGNYWMPEAIAYLDNLDKLRLGGGMSESQTAAMQDGALRAKEQLNLAASLAVSANGDSVKIINHTGHKLISGYPEGRRMWLNIIWYDSSGEYVREDGRYGEIGVVINGVNIRSLVDLAGTRTKIYQAHMGMTQEWAVQLRNLGYQANLALSYDRNTGDVEYTLGELASASPGTQYETFHFVLNNIVINDNRIPPYGMGYDAARERNTLPVPADQYGGTPGGTYDYFDVVALDRPTNAASATVNLMYQPTSWEYIQFLSLANNGSSAFLAEEGDNILDAWLHTGMAEPYIMASATWNTPPGQCDMAAPVLLSANPADKQIEVNWQENNTSADLEGYRLYYDEAGKAQLVSDLLCPAGDQSACTGYTDTSLTNGQEYCYKATAYGSSCESGFSNILCAVPTQPGQTVLAGVVEPISTGKWVSEGKGKNAIETFVVTSDFTAGDTVVIQATVKDQNGNPVADATVTIELTGPEAATLTSASSDENGHAEATWQTSEPNKKGNGGTATGDYLATVIAVTASGYDWDQLHTSVNFSLSP